MAISSRHRRQRQSRSLLLWLAGVFVFGQAATGLWFDHVSARGRFTALYRQLDLLEEAPLNHAILCFGSSRTGTALIDVDVARALRKLDRGSRVEVFNMWVPQGDLLTTEFALDQVLRAGRRPKLAIIEVVPDYFHETYDFLEDNVLRVMGWRESFRDQAWLRRKGLFPLIVEARLMPLHVYRNEISHGVIDWQQTTGRRFFQDESAPGAWDEDMQRKQSLHVYSRFPMVAKGERDARVQQWLSDHRATFGNYQIDRDSVAVLERVLQRCANEGIRVFLWMPPLCSERRACYTAKIDAAFHGELERLQRRYHFEYHDARACLRDDQLRDTHHLTLAGAEQFSKQFAAELLAPAWAKVNGGPAVEGLTTAHTQ